MLAQVRKDANNACYRILDHRAFVKGEIERTLYNFETQRNDKEVETLFNVAQTVAELKYELSDKCIKLSNSYLSKISETLVDCLSNLESFVSEKNQINPEPNKFLIQSRETRRKQKTIFNNELAHKYKRMQDTFEEKEEEIAEIYTDLQRKLNIQK